MPEFPKKPNVNTPTADYLEMERKRWLCRVLSVGTGSTEEAGSFLGESEKLLPRYGSEFEPDYEFRRDHLTVVPPDFGDSVDNVVAAILNGPIIFEDTAPEFWDSETRQGDWLSIDRAGRRGDAFLAGVGTESISEGLPGVFIDYWQPSRTVGAAGREEAMASGRPYWSHIHAVDLIDTTHVDGLMVRARWRERAPSQGETEWEQKSIPRVRVLYRGDSTVGRDDDSRRRYARWETWRENPDKTKRDEEPWVKQTEPLFPGDQPEGILSPPAGLADDEMDEFIEIPLYLFYGGYRRQGVAWPLLRHQAELIRLWVLMHSDFAGAQHYAANPREVVVGTSEEQYAEDNPGNTPAGQGNLTFLSQQGSEWKILAHDGRSFDSLQKFLDKIADMAERAGPAAMRKQATGRELATLGLLDREKKLTRLEVISAFWEDAFGSCTRRDELLRGISPPKARAKFPEPNKDLLVSPGAQMDILKVSAANDLADPETWWQIARSISGNEDIDPEAIAGRLAAFQNSGAL